MKLLPTIFFSFLAIGASLAQATLQGQVNDAKTGEPIIFGMVAVYQNGVLITGFQTDFDGNYTINEIPEGSYEVVFSYTGYSDYKVTGVEILEGKSNVLKTQLTRRTESSCIAGYRPPLIRLHDTTQGFKFTSEQMSKMAFRW